MAIQLTAVKHTEYEFLYVFGAVNPLTKTSWVFLAPMTHATNNMNHNLGLISEQAVLTVPITFALDHDGPVHIEGVVAL